MPVTLAQLKDQLGDPIVFLQHTNPVTHVTRAFTDADLGPVALAVVLAWINARLAEEGR
jgi:hypothetical protein